MILKNDWLCLMIMVCCISCAESEYSRLVKEEMAKQSNLDSLFFTFKFGDTQKEFFAKGWEVNKTGKIKQGPGNSSVEYIIKPEDSVGSPIQMLFYPKFTEDSARLHIMDARFTYTGWSPGTKIYNSNNLLESLKDTLMGWYGGNSFLKVELEEDRPTLWVKVDGNRQLTMHIMDERWVSLKFEDLNVKYQNGFK